MRWIGRREVALATGLGMLAASLVVAAPASAEVDPVYEASLGISDAAMTCQWWPVLDDGDWNYEQVGPATGDFDFTTTVSTIADGLSPDDYRLIFTFGSETIDGVGWNIAGGGSAPGGPGEEADGVVTTHWSVPVGSTATSIGIKLIGLDETNQWVLVHTGTIPVVDTCTPPTQQIGAPDTIAFDGDPVSGGAVKAYAPGAVDPWVCGCTLQFALSLLVDGEVAWTGTTANLQAPFIDIPPHSAGKSAQLKVTVSPDGSASSDALWTPVTLYSDTVAIGAAPPLTGALHLFAADPTDASPPPDDLACSVVYYPTAGSQLWASPWTGSWHYIAGDYVCNAYKDLATVDDTAPAGDVTWFADGEELSATGNPLTITEDMCGKTITATQTWSNPHRSDAVLASAASYPVYCVLSMTPGTPTIDGTPAVGQPLTVNTSQWVPATATFTYQWYVELDSSGTNMPIEGATSATFTPTIAQAGHRVWAGVEGHADGYAGAWTLSSAVTVADSVPSAPRGLKATAKSTSVALTWSAPSASGGQPISGYRVQRSTNGTSWTTIATTTSRSYTATKLTNGTKYWFRVIATNAKGSSSASTAVTSVPCTKPSAPRSLHATAKSKSVALTWSAPASNGGAKVSAYKVYKSTNGSSFTLVKTVTTRSATVSSLTKGKKYWFRVVAVNAAGASAPSAKTASTPK
jgi:hypothetical protein